MKDWNYGTGCVKEKKFSDAKEWVWYPLEFNECVVNAS